MRKAVLLLSILFVSCATIRNGPMERVRVESEPQGAMVRLDQCGLLSTRSSVTPATVWVSRRSTQCRIVVSMPGEEEQTLRLERELSASLRGYPDAVAGYCGPNASNCNSLDDLFVLGFVSIVVAVPGLAVDFATGSMFALEPSHIVAEFRHPAEERK